MKDTISYKDIDDAIGSLRMFIEHITSVDTLVESRYYLMDIEKIVVEADISEEEAKRLLSKLHAMSLYVKDLDNQLMVYLLKIHPFENYHALYSALFKDYGKRRNKGSNSPANEPRQGNNSIICTNNG